MTLSTAACTARATARAFSPIRASQEKTYRPRTVRSFRASQVSWVATARSSALSSTSACTDPSATRQCAGARAVRLAWRPPQARSAPHARGRLLSEIEPSPIKFLSPGTRGFALATPGSASAMAAYIVRSCSSSGELAKHAHPVDPFCAHHAEFLTILAPLPIPYRLPLPYPPHTTPLSSQLLRVRDAMLP